ncbi:tetratricopeptide repeat protein [Allomesorhizobium camelthorni]|uniref:Tetratricopeptide repeat protein n=1 Tax=Allomesorhizobium camelthorni TaxID=475069 RepID=A0A6G4W679_9HYPH|nr:tetratricopeptide repeat protein [Mesorhizobium camelthorni]NGO50255.1 tetratricopeptide repeat protein [Mesorhizobium camelthorni]
MLLGIFLITAALCGLATASASEAPSFVGSQSCASCHQTEFEAWTDSHHGWALREPTPQNVLGDFNDASFEHKGITSRFFRENERFFVETDGADGKLARFEIKYVVGVAPLQQYLVEIEGGRLQALDIAWNVEAGRWYHLYPDEDVSAGNGLHWTGFYKNWQARCAVCHQTDFQKNYDPKSRSYQSTWAELTVGCEACHGPGEAHVAWAEKRPGYDSGRWSGLAPHGLLTPRSEGRQAIEQDMCGPCHARREAIGPDSTLPGAPFGDHYNLSTLGDGLYFPDGQQDQEVYILSSFLQSKMHEKGVTCSDCHDSHSGGLVAEGNAVCTQCHNPVGRSEFPSLVLKDFDTPDHHHHKEGSAGAQCVSCHMPERDYMVVDGRRDHFFRVPDPLLSQSVGSPDACLSCHTGETAQWASAAIAGWAPDSKPRDHAYATLFAGVQRQGLDPEKLAGLVDLARNTEEPAIVRASALREIGDRGDAATARALAGLLTDDSELIRMTAVRLWRQTQPQERVERLQPLLDDPVASVRIAAALELASIPPEALAEDRRAALGAALDGLRASMGAKADFPEAQMAIGGLAMTMRNWDAAQAAFAEAVFMDPQLIQAWLTRARIAEALGEMGEAAAILASAREHNPDDAGLAAQLAQLLIQQGRPREAVPVLKDSVAADPGNEEMRINLAFALLQTGDLSAAAAEIDLLRSRAPDRPEVEILHALHQVASGDLAAARETVRGLKQRYPNLRLPPQLDALSQIP